MFSTFLKGRIGQLIFFGCSIFALLLYVLTVPDGLPWSLSTHYALAYLGETPPPYSLPNPIWGRYVQVFRSAIALSCTVTALAAGLVGVMVNRHLGGRVAVAAAAVWAFFPWVWNGAILGERKIVLVSVAVAALWMVGGLVRWVSRKLVWLWKRNRNPLDVLALPSVRVGRFALIGAAAFALVSMALHDYRLGEAASAFVRGFLPDIGERLLVMNGLCDDQVVREVPSAISLRNDDAHRARLVKWAQTEWPDDIEMLKAAQTGASELLRRAYARNPERFYLMNGTSTTLEAWERRWQEFAPYLDSSDPFVTEARRAFGVEGNAVANALQDADKANAKRAWQLYWTIFETVNPGNVTALFNLCEMMRRGYPASPADRHRLAQAMAEFLGQSRTSQQARQAAAAAGPIRPDPELQAKVETEMRQRLAEKVAAGDVLDASPELLSLVEWNNTMVGALESGDYDRAARIARVILSNPRWLDHIPANAVLGATTAQEGDYRASEAFFRNMMAHCPNPPAASLNDFADTLMHLDKLDEAEDVARRAVDQTDDTFWLPRLTLAQILTRKKDASRETTDEIRRLLQSVRLHAPEKMREKARLLRKDGSP